MVKDARVGKRKVRCKKCGSTDINTVYHETRKFPHDARCRDYFQLHSESMKEHLHYFCRVCRFDSIGNCLKLRKAKGRKK